MSIVLRNITKNDVKNNFLLKYALINLYLKIFLIISPNFPWIPSLLILLVIILNQKFLK